MPCTRALRQYSKCHPNILSSMVDNAWYLNEICDTLCPFQLAFVTSSCIHATLRC